MYLSRKDIRKRWPISDTEIKGYLRKQHLSYNEKNIKRATQLLRAAKQREETGAQVSFSQSAVPWQVCYGRARLGGAFTYVRTRGDNLNLHLILTLTGHEIAGIDRLWLDGDEVIFKGALPNWSQELRRTGVAPIAALDKIRLSYTTGHPDQVTDPEFLDRNDDRITSDFRQRGCAYAYLLMLWDITLFPDGLPDILFELRGKPVYDPRTTQTAWTDSFGKHIGQNAALVVADFMTDTRIGLGIPWAQIDTDALNEAANICEQSVTLSGGGTEWRYTANGTFDLAQDKRAILEQLVAAMAGTVIYSGGKWKIRAGAYRAPTITLTDSDWVSPLQIETATSRQDSFNAVRGTYLAADRNYEEREFPTVSNQYYQAEDSGAQVFEDIQLPFTTSSATAQRLAKIYLEANRQGITISATASLKALQLEVGDCVQVTRSRLGWTSKVFLVQEIELITETDEQGAPFLAVRLLLQEFASAIYDWANGEETFWDIAPNTDLPSPWNIAPPTGLALSSGTDQLYIRSDGTVFSRIKVSWTPIADAYVNSGGFVEVYYGKSSDRAQPGYPTYAGAVPGDQSVFYILDAQDGVQYDVLVKAKNAAGVRSEAAQVLNYQVVGKTAAPSNVQGLSGTVDATGVRLHWNPVPDKDVASYEVRYTNESGTWDDAVFLGSVTGTTFATGVTTGGTYLFLVKAKDTSGNYSTAAAQLRSVIPVPAAPVVSIRIDNYDVVISWTAPSSYFDIDHYEVRYSSPNEDDPVPDFSTALSFVTTKALTYRSPVSWLGTRWFYVFAVDVKGNAGAHTSVSLQVNAPSRVTIVGAEVIDNNVLIRWATPTGGSLPILKYQLFRGDVFETSMLIGELSNTFATVFESVAGKYTYWIRAVDSANNRGSATSVTLEVSSPPDFVLTASGRLIPAEARLGKNVLIDGVGFVVGAGGPGGAGSPMGLLAAITYARGSLARVAGVPIGLLAAITYARTGTGGSTGGQGSPVGLLMAITSAGPVTWEGGSPIGVLTSVTWARDRAA